MQIRSVAVIALLSHSSLFNLVCLNMAELLFMQKWLIFWSGEEEEKETVWFFQLIYLGEWSWKEIGSDFGYENF